MYAAFIEIFEIFLSTVYLWKIYISTFTWHYLSRFVTYITISLFERKQDIFFNNYNFNPFVPWLLHIYDVPKKITIYKSNMAATKRFIATRVPKKSKRF